MPALHTMSVPQIVPFARSAPSTQTDVPVEHEVTPRLQRGPGWSRRRGRRCRRSRCPRCTPCSCRRSCRSPSAVASTQTEAPVAQEVTPSWQSASGLVAQESPAVQEEQVPALHTRFVPQLVPFGMAVVVFTQVSPPVAQEVTPGHALVRVGGAGEARRARDAGAGAVADLVHAARRRRPCRARSASPCPRTAACPSCSSSRPRRTGSGSTRRRAPPCRRCRCRRCRPRGRTGSRRRSCRSASPSTCRRRPSVPVAHEVDAVDARVRVAWRRRGRPCTRCRRPLLQTSGRRSSSQDGAVRLGVAALFSHCDAPVAQEVMPVTHWLTLSSRRAPPRRSDAGARPVADLLVPQVVPVGDRGRACPRRSRRPSRRTSCPSTQYVRVGRAGVPGGARVARRR